MKIILGGMPQVVGLERAIDVIPGMKQNLILHAGPPVTWDRMCGPMRGAIIGALIYEEKADSPREAAAAGRLGRDRVLAHATSTARSGRWRASFRLRCRCGSSRTKRSATWRTAR